MAKELVIESCSIVSNWCRNITVLDSGIMYNRLQVITQSSDYLNNNSIPFFHFIITFAVGVLFLTEVSFQKSILDLWKFK